MNFRDNLKNKWKATYRNPPLHRNLSTKNCINIWTQKLIIIQQLVFSLVIDLSCFKQIALIQIILEIDVPSRVVSNPKDD